MHNVQQKIFMLLQHFIFIYKIIVEINNKIGRFLNIYSPLTSPVLVKAMKLKQAQLAFINL